MRRPLERIHSHPRCWRTNRSLGWLAACGCLLGLLPHLSATGQTRDSFELARKQLVQEVIIRSGITSQPVVEAMMSTPRHEFVARQYRNQAYFDMSLPIGDSQTISSPYIVAFMTQALDPQPTDRVLEIGTGSGYQAAVLSPIVKDVYTIEIVEPLGERADRTLKRLRYANVHTKIGDGYLGWPEHAPFDKIIVTCSPERVPVPLQEQLREGGLMVIPVGERYQQTLYLMRKKEGKLISEALQPTLFVPMTGKAEQGREVKPDPANPRLINGDFEEKPQSADFVPGWYYQRLATLGTEQPPQGQQFAAFSNQDPGRPSHLLQGLAVDGREVRGLKMSAMLKLINVRNVENSADFATIAMTFYDENRRDLGFQHIGPLQGSQDWKRVEYTFRVPPQAREALFRIGLFGATGYAALDDIQWEVVRE